MAVIVDAGGDGWRDVADVGGSRRRQWQWHNLVGLAG